MRVLYVYCHPLEGSFHAAIRHEALGGLRQAGHAVDLLDLYAEGFDPVLSAGQRRDYHDPAKNRANNQAHVDRLMAAEALIVQFPTWSFGPPAMLKGWFDHLFGPGIAMDLSVTDSYQAYSWYCQLWPPALAGDRHGGPAAQDHQALSAMVHRRASQSALSCDLSHEHRDT
jgi:putative NADPH-quinone reductase